MSSPLLLLALVACQGTEEPETPPIEPPPTGAREALSPADHLIRASISLRGLRPSAEEIAAVTADPAALDGLVDGWVRSEAFGDTLKTMHAELFLTRTDADDQLPSLGVAEGYSTNQMHEATAEEPLELVRYIAMEGRPYTEVVADIYGLDIDRSVSGWRPARWADGRPHAGVLSSSQLYRRHVSAGSNFHRLRANVLAETLLCESFANRDVVVSGGVDLTDEAAVARAVRENANCIACHQGLDPLAATLWGFKRQVDPRAVEGAYALSDCAPDPDRPQPPIDEGDLPTDYCYPLVMYTPSKEDRWAELDLRPPGYYGSPVVDLADLGQQIAADPRFAQCAVRRFYSWYTQQEADDIPLELVADLTDRFEASGFDARALAKAIVTSEPFAAARPFAPGDAPLQSVRPEAYAAIVEDLTGFRWLIEPVDGNCAPTCWDTVDLGTSDKWGYRAMAGGVDGFQVLHPTHTPTPNKVLVTQRMAAEAAAFVVGSDFSLPAAQRRLLTAVEPTDTDADAVRAQLDAMYAQALGPGAYDAVDLDEAVGLFTDALARSGDPAHAWTLSISLLLQDPRLLTY